MQIIQIVEERYIRKFRKTKYVRGVMASYDPLLAKASSLLHSSTLLHHFSFQCFAPLLGDWNQVLVPESQRPQCSRSSRVACLAVLTRENAVPDAERASFWRLGFWFGSVLASLTQGMVWIVFAKVTEWVLFCISLSVNLG